MVTSYNVLIGVM